MVPSDDSFISEEEEEFWYVLTLQTQTINLFFFQYVIDLMANLH